MKRYIREIFIPEEYARNFNKELSALDIKFYGKIHFDRSRSNNEQNMHYHLVVSRKDQTNKKKLSPLTNHKNTKIGIIKGGFDRVNLFQQAEQGFDKLFRFLDRQQTESFDYQNVMKNCSISEQLNLQKQDIQSDERKIEVDQNSNIENKNRSNQALNQERNQASDSFISFVRREQAFSITSKSKYQSLKRKRRKDTICDFSTI